MSAGVRERILKLTRTFEDTPISLGRWLLVLGAIIVLRHFLEQLSGQQKTLYFLSYFIHYPLAYVAPLLALSVVLAAFARERIERVTRLMLFAWLLTLLPPLIDILLARAAEGPELIGYLIPRSGTLGGAFLNLWNPAYQQFQGATAGIRIESAVGCILGAFYVHLKTKSVGRTVLAFVAIYVTMFFFFTLPVVTVAVSRLLGGNVENVYQLFFARAAVHRAFANATPFALSDLSNSLIDLLVIAPLLAIWYRMYDRERFRLAAGLVNPVAVAFHLVTTFAGMVLGAKLLMQSEGLLSVAHPFDVISIIGLLAASFFTALTAQAIRKLHDEEEPLSSDDRNEVLMIAAFCFSFATLFALTVSYVTTTYVLAILASYYFYYARPMRLCRFTPASGFVLGGVTLFSVTLGLAAYAGGSASLWMPKGMAAVCVLVPTLALLARDVWEIAADGSDRWNLRGLVGEGRVRPIAAAGVLVASLLPGALLDHPPLFVPGAIVGVVGAALVLRLPRGRLPGAMILLGTASLIVALAMGATDAPPLRDSLSMTDFTRMTRRSGEFEMFDRDVATEEQRMLAEGVELFRRGDYAGSVDIFRQILENDPENTQALLSIGSAYMRMERLSEAGRSFRRAVALEPENAQAHVGLAQVHKLGGDPDAALEELAVAVELDPESADAHYTKAIIYQELGELELELEALEATASVDPRHSMALSRLADIYLANEMYQEAAAALKAALLGRTPVEHAHTRLAEAYYAQGDFEAAENELRKETALRPRLASPHANLARLLAEMGRTAEAVHEYETAIQLTNDERLKEFLEGELAALRG